MSNIDRMRRNGLRMFEVEKAFYDSIFNPKPKVKPITKGGFCGTCSAMTDRERCKTDCCPTCGKSLYAYKKGSKFQ